MPSNPTFAFGLSTKDRVDFTRQILPGLDVDPLLHLYWFDGSDTELGTNLPSASHFNRTTLKEIHYDVKGGPDAAIRYALDRMLSKGYDYVGLIENDVLLSPGWFGAMSKAIAHAETAGLSVGAVTVRTIACRCLFLTEFYAVMWNMGAGMVLFSKVGANAILEDYKGTGSQEVNAFWQERGFQLQSWDLWRDQPDRGLGADWWYAAAMFTRGLVSIGTVPTYGENVDFNIERDLRSTYVMKFEEQTSVQRHNELTLFGRYRGNNIGGCS